MKISKRQKFLLIVPLVFLPLALLAYWYLQKNPVQSTRGTSGINVNLPTVNQDKKDPRNKMSYYKKAESDSAKWEEMTKKDPYYDLNPKEVPHVAKSLDLRVEGPSSKLVAPDNTYTDPNEEMVHRKLDELEKILNTPDMPSEQVRPDPSIELPSTDIDQLELMMEQMTTPEAEDPELEQLNNMLETILDIQHPQRVQHRLEELSRENKGHVYAVSTGQKETPISVLDQGKTSPAAPGFFGLEPFPQEGTAQNTIPAVIHETQSLVTGSTIKLRLVRDIFIAGEQIPKGNFVFGTVNISGERLNIRIDGIRYRNSLFPVNLEAYSIDGNQGLHIPGAIARKVAKESSGQTVQGLGLGTFDNSLEAQAASAGVEATKNLLSRKAKLIKVTVKAGDQVLLKDMNQKNN